MKIGITCYPTYGGSGVVATELGLELAQRGHEIHFISYAQPIRFAAKSLIFTIMRSKCPAILYLTILLMTWRSPPEWRKSLSLRSRSVARSLRHSAFGKRIAGAADAG